MLENHEKTEALEEETKQKTVSAIEAKQLKQQEKREKKKQKKQKTPKGMVISSALFFGITTIVGWALFLLLAIEMATLPSGWDRLAIIILLPLTVLVMLAAAILYIIPFSIGIKGTVRIAKNTVMEKTKKFVLRIYFIFMIILPVISDAAMVTTLVLILRSLNAA